MEVLIFFLILLGLVFIYLLVLFISFLRTGINYHKSAELYFVSKTSVQKENVEEEDVSSSYTYKRRRWLYFIAICYAILILIFLFLNIFKV